MRNLFTELGHSESDSKKKLDEAFYSLFFGDEKNERVYFEVSDDEAFIEDIGHSDIRSEGMSYGMAICAMLKKRELFDKLWNFSKRRMLNKKGPWKGYFAWQVSAQDLSVIDEGSAPDGEEYFAFALLAAAQNFQDDTYLQEARALLKDMAYKTPEKNVETLIDRRAQLVRFSPAKGNDFTDPSYHTLAFYRLFAKKTQDDFWNALASKSLDFLVKTIHQKTGLSPEYSEFDGAPKATPWYPESDCFSGDAWRVIMNLSLDYSLTHFSEELELIERTLSYFEKNRPYFADQKIDGSKFPGNPRVMTKGLIAMNAAGASALPKNHPLIKPFVEDLWNQTTPTGLWRYYDGMLHLLGLLSCMGIFQEQLAEIKSSPLKV